MPNANIFQHKENLEGFTVDNKTATIAQGASQSGVIDLEGYQLATLHMPAAWDAADLAGIVKEIYDKVSGKGTPEGLDWLATCLGGMFGAGIHYLILGA